MKNRSKNDTHIKYLVTNEQDKSWGITVNSVGFQSIGPGKAYPPANHPAQYLFSPSSGRTLDEYQLIYTVRGQGTFTSASHRGTTIKAGYMYMLFPGEWHSYKPDPETGWDEYWIGFQGRNIDARREEQFFQQQRPFFRVGIQDEIVKLFELAIITARDQKAGFQQMLGGIVNMLLGYAYYHEKNYSFEDIAVAKQINEAKIIMRENFKDGIKPEEIASRVNMGYSWFRHIFKTYTGFAPNQYILELKILHGKSLLTNTTLSIKEIAYESGFENQEYFCTIFKKKTGSTPMQYRKATSTPDGTDD